MNLKIFIIFTCIFTNDAQNVLKFFLQNTILYKSISGILKNPNNECTQQIKNSSLSTLILMADASQKFINGIADGNFYGLGSYDECLNIKEKDIKATYCLIKIPVMEIKKIIKHISGFELKSLHTKNTEKGIGHTALRLFIGKSPDKLGLLVGVCLPEKCASEAVKLTKNDLLKPLEFDENYCYTKDKFSMSYGATLMMIFLTLIFSWTALATIYDILLSTPETEGALHRILISFSLLSNVKKLLKVNTNDDYFDCLSGLKVISMMWVVLGHSYANISLTMAVDNSFEALNWINNTSTMLLLSAPLSVDTFLTIAGLLTTYTFLKNELSRPQTLPYVYLHRYLRLTPAFFVIIMMYTSGLILYFGDGPFWNEWYDLEIKFCRSSWWSNLLYLQNYLHPREDCVVQSWYLAVHFQLFLLSPLILMPLKKHERVGLVVMLVLVLLGMVVPFTIAYKYKINGLGLDVAFSGFMDKYYKRTEARFGPYVIGMILGYVIYKLKSQGDKIRLRRRAVLLWTLCILGLLICIFDGKSLVNNPNNAFLDGLYVGLNKSIWSLCISLLIFLCVTGNGGMIDKFLSLPTFQIFSKLSYSIYLVHYACIMIINLSKKNQTHFSNVEIISHFCAHFAFSVAAAVVLFLIFESPIVALEKSFFHRDRNRRHLLPKYS